MIELSIRAHSSTGEASDREEKKKREGGGGGVVATNTTNNNKKKKMQNNDGDIVDLYIPRKWYVFACMRRMRFG